MNLKRFAKNAIVPVLLIVVTFLFTHQSHAALMTPELKLTEVCQPQIATMSDQMVGTVIAHSFNQVDPSFFVKMETVHRYDAMLAGQFGQLIAAIFYAACDQEDITPNQAIRITMEVVHPMLNFAIQGTPL